MVPPGAIILFLPNCSHPTMTPSSLLWLASYRLFQKRMPPVPVFSVKAGSPLPCTNQRRQSFCWTSVLSTKGRRRTYRTHLPSLLVWARFLSLMRASLASTTVSCRLTIRSFTRNASLQTRLRSRQMVCSGSTTAPHLPITTQSSPKPSKPPLVSIAMFCFVPDYCQS